MSHDPYMTDGPPHRYVLTSAHGTERIFEAGDILFQDNTATDPG